jgi:Uma2 family endonuclease
MRAWRIYCGRRRSKGRPVTEAELRSFINSSIRPRFDAFTIQRARGYWQATSEPSFVIEIVHPSDSAQANVAEIAADYKRRFGQDAVLIVRSDVQSALV